MKELGIICSYLTELIHSSSDNQQEVEYLYKKCNIPQPDLADPSSFLPVASLAIFWNEMILKMGEPHAGLLLSEKGQFSMWGMVGYLAQTCPDLKTAIDKIVKYQGLIDSLGELKVHKQKKVFVMELIDEPDFVLNYPKVQQCAVEYLVASFLYQVRQLIKKELKVIAIEFNFPEPLNQEIYQKYLKTKCTFGAKSTKIFIHEKDFLTPLVTHNPILFGHFIQIVDAQAATKDPGLSGKVSELIRYEIKGNKVVSIESVAEVLLVSTRTLQRQLTAERTSFNTLYQDVKRELSISLLRHGKLSIKDVSFLLGYNEASAFRKAFKGWTGHPPSSFQ